jgi:glycosyltransferase involved in cell wall biosynthesis
METISVIIPMYNSGLTTVKAVDSVRNQTYQKCKYEIFVINDGSTDNSLQIIKDYQEKNNIHNLKIINKKNGGPATARNAGLRVATGAYLCLLDSDDEWVPEKIETQIQTLEFYPEIDFLGCNLVGKRIKIFGKEIKQLYKVTTLQLLLKHFPQTSTIIFKRNILVDVGYFNEDKEVSYYGEDNLFFIKISTKKKIFFSPEELVIYGQGKHSFALKGLGANIKEMAKGERRNLRYAYKNNLINAFQFYWLRIFQYLKYLRRLYIVAKMRTKCNIYCKNTLES